MAERKKFTVQVSYAAYQDKTVVVEAEDVAGACAAAVVKANNDGEWTSSDHCGDTFVDFVRTGEHSDAYVPSDEGHGEDVPPEWTEAGVLQGGAKADDVQAAA